MPRPPVQRPRTLNRIVVSATLAIVAACAPTPTTAPGSPGESAGASPQITARPSGSSAVEATGVLETFYAAVEDSEALSFHVVQLVEFTLDGEQTPSSVARFEVDISGHSGAGSMLAIAAGESLTLDIVFIDVSVWTRPVEGDWTLAAPGLIDPSDLWDVWRYLPRIEDVRPTSQGASLLAFVSEAAVPYQTSSMRASGSDGSIVRTDLYLTPEGAPARIVWDIEATGVVGGTTVDMTATSTISISEWGASFEIDPPVD